MNVSFCSLTNLASGSLGAQVLSANDEFFAPKANLVLDTEAVNVADKFTEVGKWMDGWETRRKRDPGFGGFDWCIVKLAARGVVHGVDVDTHHFVGNFPEGCSIEGTDCESAKLKTAVWRPLAARTLLKGGTNNLIGTGDPLPVTHIRLNIFPDGGVARFRVYGRVVVPKLKGLVDLAALLNGGWAVTCSDMFFSHKDNLIRPGRSKFMGGGWETKRRRGPGFDWIIVQLAARGLIERIEIDTDHYKGNFPDRACVDGLAVNENLAPEDFRDRNDLNWEPILKEVKLKPDFSHTFTKEIVSKGVLSVFSYVRLSIFPDGGIARMRVMGRASD